MLTFIICLGLTITIILPYIAIPALVLGGCLYGLFLLGGAAITAIVAATLIISALVFIGVTLANKPI